MHRELVAIVLSVVVPVTPITADDAAAETVDLKRTGAFGFPQDQARVLTDTDDLRVSVFSDNAHMYVQAILWSDDNDALGETSDGRPIGDHSSLCIDADADGEVTANVDRTYALNPWPTLPGLRYSIELGGGASTGLQVDSDGSGAIRYVSDASGKTVRVDSFLIPLDAIGRKTGDVIRMAYWASSTKPEFVANSVGFKTDRKTYWSHHLPHEMYHKVELTAGELVVMPSVVPDGRQDDVPDGAKPEPLAKMPAVGAAPPELVADDWINTDGPLTLADLRGDVVVVEFWATWCTPCVAGIPHLNELHEKHAKDGLRIVSFTDQARSHVEEFMKKTPMKYALGMGSPLSRRYGVTGIPHAFIVGRDGLLRWHGHPSTAEFDKQLAAVLNEHVGE
jgi:thiol-disulfide isomerase/thioredoxin